MYVIFDANHSTTFCTVTLLSPHRYNNTMVVPRNSLRGFLAHAKGALRNAIEKSEKVTLVIGNESAGERGTGHST
jgi:hypothetical protein